MPPPARRRAPEELVAVRVRPGASRTRVSGRYDGPYGSALVVAVTARPVAGRATDEVLRVVARALGVRRRSVSIRAGGTSRDKLVAVVDPPQDLTERVAMLCDGLG